MTEDREYDSLYLGIHTCIDYPDRCPWFTPPEYLLSADILPPRTCPRCGSSLVIRVGKYRFREVKRFLQRPVRETLGFKLK